MSSNNVQDVCSFIRYCTKVSDIGVLKETIRTELRQIFPHQMAVFGIAQLSPYQAIRLINVDFPESYLQRIVQPDQTFASHLFRSWLDQQKPRLTMMEEQSPLLTGQCYRAAHDHNIHNIASYGVIDARAATFSYFVFGNVCSSVASNYDQILAVVVPQLHVCLVRSLTMKFLSELRSHAILLDSASSYSPNKEKDSPKLTDREKQILKSICIGKSNRQIGEILNISEFTVKTHVKNLFFKLSAKSRTQAVTNAVNARLLEL